MGYKTRLKIAPDYEGHEALIRDIVSGKLHGEIIHKNRRNIVELVVCDNLRFVVKRNKPSSLYHKILYSGLRDSKVRKAYNNAVALLREGVATAEPVAYAERRRFGLFHDGVFISLFVEGGLIVDIYNPAIDEKKKKSLCEAAGKFTCDLHSKGFYPLDYNPGNLIYSASEDEDGYSITVIDVNRMSMGKTRGVCESMRGFSQLGLRPKEFIPVLGPYADGMGFDLEECIYHTLKWRRKLRGFKRFKRAAAKFVGLGRKE